MNAVAKVHRADGKDHFPEFRNGAIVEAIHPRSADNIGIPRGAVISNIGIALLQTDCRVVNRQRLEFLISSHVFSSEHSAVFSIAVFYIMGDISSMKLL